VAADDTRPVGGVALAAPGNGDGRHGQRADPLTQTLLSDLLSRH
jgi:hypothetical protein